MMNNNINVLDVDKVIDQLIINAYWKTTFKLKLKNNVPQDIIQQLITDADYQVEIQSNNKMIKIMVS